MSAICEAFSVPPDVAERQEWAISQAILDYRNAGHALALLKRGSEGFRQLAETPQLCDLVLAMMRAQTGQALSVEEALGSVSGIADRADEAGKEKDEDEC